MNGDRRTLGVICLLRHHSQLAAETMQSVHALADELLLVDCRDDRKAPIPAGAIRATWENDFSAVRRFALQRCNADWVLWLEPGEVLGRYDGNRLREFVEESAEEHVAYLLDVWRPGSAHGPRQVIGELRLHARGAPVAFQGRLGALEIEDETACRLAELPIDVRTPASDGDPAIAAPVAAERIKLARLDIAESGVDAHLLCVIGDAHADLGEPDLAERAYREAAAAAKPGSRGRLEAYYGLASTATSAERRLCAAIVALDEFPCDAPMLLQLGRGLESADKIELAAEAYCLALDHGRVRPEAGRSSDLAEQAAEHAARSLERLQRHDDALALLRRAVEQLPGSRRLRRRLAALLMERSQWEEAETAAEGLARTAEERRQYQAILHGAAECVAGRWISAIAFLESVFEAGCRDPLCIVWLQRLGRRRLPRSRRGDRRGGGRRSRPGELGAASRPHRDAKSLQRFDGAHAVGGASTLGIPHRELSSTPAPETSA